MNKKILTIGILACLLFVGTITAVAPQTYSTRLYQKDPSDWSIVPGGAYGSFYAMEKTMVVPVSRENPTYGQIVYPYTCEVNDLNPNTRYVLINHHDEWPFADRISFINTDAKGDGAVSGIMYNEPADKIWVVLSSDFDSKVGRFTSWNPTEYLFENNLV